MATEPDDDEKRRDEVLTRMLQTPPKPHKPKAAKSKPEEDARKPRQSKAEKQTR